jgi:hypothetical protein
MLVTLLVLAWMAFVFPRICREIGGFALTAGHRALGL